MAKRANKAKAKDLVRIIRDNPGCVATIDNDFWVLRKGDPEPDGFDDWTCEAQDRWQEAVTLATSRDEFLPMGDAGFAGNCYGGDILQALAVLAGIRVEGA